MPPQADRLIESFVGVALRHELISDQQAEQVIAQASRDGTDQADAVLALSLLTPQQVDAVQLLANPMNSAPGYKLLEFIGSGSAAIVFRATQQTLQRDVAIKTIGLKNQNQKSSGARIQREAQLIGRLKHPNIVAVYDSGFSQGRFFIAMELVDGDDLATWIDRSGPLPERTTWKITRQVAAALAHASAHGVIHRDIKPGNILLTSSQTGDALPENCFVKVADFGLAFSVTAKDTNLTATGTTLGTPAYVAPEQLLETHVDVRADIYSLGATVFHMLSGKPPYFDTSPMKAIIDKTVGKDTWRDRLPDGFSPCTAELLRAMTESEASDRIGDYDDLMARIDSVLEKIENRPVKVVSPPPLVHAPPVPPPPVQWQSSLKPNKPRSFFDWRALLVAAVVLSLIAFLLLPKNAGQLEPGPQSSATWIPSGLPEPLFNGRSVPRYPWSGGWSATKDSEGGRVLVAQRGAWMTFPLKTSSSDTPNVRFRINVQPQESALAAIEFVMSHPDRQKTLLLIGQGQARLVDASDNGTEKTASGSQAIELPSGEPGESIFQQCHISRQGDLLLVAVNGVRLGSVKCAEPVATKVTIGSRNGSVHFADIDVVGLVEESKSEQQVPDWFNRQP